MWIEILWENDPKAGRYVTPFAGVWIEINVLSCFQAPSLVTPFAGVWIEIVLPCYAAAYLWGYTISVVGVAL